MPTMPAISCFNSYDCCWQLCASSAACLQISVNFYRCYGVTSSSCSPSIQINISLNTPTTSHFHALMISKWQWGCGWLLFGASWGRNCFGRVWLMVQLFCMLAIEKSKDLIQQINRILRRMEHIKEVKTQQFQFLAELQQLYSSFSQRIHKEMIVFEENIIKNSLYSTQKTNYILNLAKIYREFAVRLEKTSKLNLLNLHRIKPDDIYAQEQKLQRKCELFLKEFQTYLAAEKNYNANYNTYSDKCALLDQTIRRYRSYQDPVAFYNQTLTNEYISELDRHYNDCTGFETTVVNDTQGLDQTRKWMGDHIKEINEYYVILLHIYLRTIESTISSIVEPKQDEKAKLALRNPDPDLTHSQNAELDKLNTLYASEINNQQHIEDNLVEEYSDLFKKTFAQNQLNSDYKFFYDRCDSLRGKKLKTTEEVFRIQTLLVNELARQGSNCAGLEKEYRVIQRDIFANNGIDSFKKRFRKYFGSNFMEAQELCFSIIDRQKKSLERIGKSTEDSREKLERLIENKQESIKFFEKRTKAILDEHLKLKQKTYSRDAVESQQLRIFKESIAVSFNELKKCFAELDKSESQVDRLFFSTLKAHCQLILKQDISKHLARTLEKEKIRVNILQSLNVDNEIILILKEDSRYEMLMNQCPKPNLYSSFQSLAKKKQYDETKRLLQMKENRLKGMIRSKQGCCGITSEPIKRNVLSHHKCKLHANGCKVKGVLNITSSGLIFQEATWNPFSDSLCLMIPQTDIHAFDVKAVNSREAVQIATDFGNLLFESKVCGEIIQSMQKNITFKLPKDGSEKSKRNDSSSFIKNNTSTEFKLSYDKSNNNGSSSGPLPPSNKPQTKPKTIDLLKDFIVKWKQSNFLSQRFTRIIKNIPEKSEGRRDYQYSNGPNKFVLKERRDGVVEGKDAVLTYEWKVCFPDTPMLHSFKHSQKVHVEGVNQYLRVRIVTGKLTEEQLFIRNKFYREIEEMNDRLSKFIVNTLQKEADILIEPEDDGQKSIDSCDIIIDQPNLDERHENTLRNSRSEKHKSGIFSGSALKTF